MNLREVQGGRGGFGESLARAGLSALSVGWRAGLWLAEGARAAGLRRAESLQRPVVSVGNLAAGGTGKTPLVAWLVERLRRDAHRPGVLARGYGPRPMGSEFSDEGEVLRRLLGPDLPYVEDPNRLRGGRTLLTRRPDVDCLVLDDGFQHRRLARDLDIVLLDATNPFAHGRLLPRGLLREPPAALARAGAVVLTRAERVDPLGIAEVRVEVSRWTDAPIAVFRTAPVALEVDGSPGSVGLLEGRRVHACSGIGNPDAFAALLRDLGARVTGRSDFSDHATFSPGRASEVRARADREGAEWVVITRKDAVKRPALGVGTAILDVAAEAVVGEEALLDRVRAALAPR